MDRRLVQVHGRQGPKGGRAKKACWSREAASLSSCVQLAAAF